MGRRVSFSLTNDKPFSTFNLDFEPRTISIQNSSGFAVYVSIGSVRIPSAKGYDAIIAPYTFYVEDALELTSFAVAVDNSAAPNIPFNYPVVITFSTGGAASQVPLSGSLQPLVGSNYDYKVMNIYSSNLVMYLPFSDLSGLVASDIAANQHWGYSATGITLNSQGIGDGKPTAAFNGSTGQVVPTAGALAYLNQANKFNPLEGTMSFWVFITSSVMGAGSFNLCTIGANGSNIMNFQKGVSSLNVNVIRGGSASALATSSYTGNFWVNCTLTWSSSGNFTRWYQNGTQIGSTTYTGVWAGALVSANTQFGSNNNISFLNGNGAKFSLANRACTPTEVANIALI